MFHHFTRARERGAGRSAGGVAVSILVHLAVLAALIYGSERVRRVAVDEARERGERWATGGAPIPGQDEPGETDDTGADAAGGDPVLPGVTLPPGMLGELGISPLLPRLPDTVELGRPRIIRLAIPRNPIPADSVLRWTDEHGVGVSPVQLSLARQATLHGASFAVQPRTPPLQLSDPERRTEWHWTLTPTEPGLQTIRLQLDAPAEVGGEPRIVTLQRLRQEVFVEATRLQRISRFFAGYWTLLAAVAIYALGAWGRAVLKNRASVVGRRSSVPGSEPDDERGAGGTIRRPTTDD